MDDYAGGSCVYYNFTDKKLGPIPCQSQEEPPTDYKQYH